MSDTDLCDHVNERALAEWTDDTGQTRTLGSVLPVNKEDAGLSLQVGLSSSLECVVRFSLDVSLLARGRSRRRTLMLVLPVDVLKPGTFTFSTLKLSEAGGPAASIHEAGLSDGGLVLAVRFSLRKPGYVVLLNSTLEVVKPSNATSSRLLDALRSLAHALDFTVYVKPSDYARVGLRIAADHVRSNSLNPLSLVLATAVGADAQPLDWSSCQPWPAKQPRRRRSSADAHRNVRRCGRSSPPPAYDPGEGPPTASIGGAPAICVRRSSSCETPKIAALSPETGSTTVPDTPPGANDGLARPKVCELDPIAVRARLEHNLALWIARACTVNRRAYCHPGLRHSLNAMGRHARNHDQRAFFSTRARCAALFFYNPHAKDDDSNNNGGGGNVAHLRAEYIADIEELLGWMLGEDGAAGSADMLVWDHLLALGKAARDVAQGSGDDVDEAELSERVATYNRAKGICASQIWTEFAQSSPEPEVEPCNA